MGGTVGGGDPPIGDPSLPLPLPPLSLIETLSISSVSPPPPPPPKRVPLPSMEPLKDAMRGTPISVEAAPRKKQRCLEKYKEFFAERERRILEDNKRLIEIFRNGTLDPVSCNGPSKRVEVRRTREKLDKLKEHKCDRGHYMCIQCYGNIPRSAGIASQPKALLLSGRKKKALEYTNQYSCHKMRGWVIPKEDDFFCPDSSCQFCGLLDSVPVHITDVHSMIIHNFSYGEVIWIPLHLVGKYVALRAEDGTAFILWVDDQKCGKILSVVCAEQPSFCKTRFSMELAYDLPPVVCSWLGGQCWTPLYYASNPRVKTWDIVTNSIVKYGKDQGVSGIANADSSTIKCHISSSNLGNIHVDNNSRALCVPWKFHDSYCAPKIWYGDLILSISSPPDAN